MHHPSRDEPNKQAKRMTHKSLPLLSQDGPLGARIAFIKRLTPFVMTICVGLSGLSLVALPKMLNPIGIERSEVGQLVAENIFAPRAIEVIDEEATAALRAEAQTRVQSLYDYDFRMLPALETRIRDFFTLMRTLHGKESSVQKALFQQHRADLMRILGTPFDSDDWSEIFRDKFDTTFEIAILECLRAIYPTYVVADRQILLPDIRRGIALRHISQQVTINGQTVNEEPFYAVENIRDLNDIKHDLQLAIKSVSNDRNRRKLALWLIERVAKPNLNYNRELTELRKRLALQSLKPVTIKVLQGERIAQKGERLTPRQALILKAYLSTLERPKRLIRALGIMLALGLVAFSSLRFVGGVSRRLPTFKDGTFVSGVLFFEILSIRALHFALSTSQPLGWIPYDVLLFAAPFATGALLVRVFLTDEAGLTVGLVCAASATFMFEGGLPLFLYVLVGSLIASTRLSRIQIWRLGFEITLVQMMGVVCGLLIEGRLNQTSLMWALLAASISGGLTVVITYCLTPLLEAILGSTTEFRLRALSDLNHPLLKRLVVSAQGTYHHSIVMGQMVEEAATLIGADPLLAKVGAYYHDIGKISLPQIYFENISQRQPEKPLSEEDLRHIRNHMMHGQILARKYRLGGAVTAIIMSHHGNKEVAAHHAYERGMSLRYPGPLPTSKEATLVMLADAVESKARTESITRPQDLLRDVDEVVETLFQEGQLAHSGLALRDLPLIKSAFVRVLVRLHSDQEEPEQRHVQALNPTEEPSAQ